MGVTVSRNSKNAGDTKNNSTSKPLQEFKRVSTRVGKMGVMARAARQKSQVRANGFHHHRAQSTDSDETATTVLPISPDARDRLISDPDIDSRLGSGPEMGAGQRRLSKAHFYDGSETAEHTLVYKDTTDAWAALRAGETVTDVENIPDTEISVVDSTLGGYHTVEKTRGGAETQRQSETEVDSGNDSSFLDNLREQSSKEEKIVIPFADGMEPPGWTEKITSHTQCDLCRAHTGHEVYPCRICTDVFHEDCLRRRGKLSDDDGMKALRAANSNLGWSCHECENLGRLLSDDDMFELMETFERCDVDSDATISLDEFIEYRQLVVKDHEGRVLTKDEIEDETRYFKSMDTDRTGTLSWWEFLNHEAIRRLAMRPKKMLVKLLTPKEIDRLRVTFTSFDTDGDGCVTDYEARRAFKNWYSKFIEDPLEMSPSAQRRLGSQTSLRMTSQLTSHVNTNTSLLMGADHDRSGSVSWEEYLMEQALYAIAVRPNLGAVKIHRKPTFCTV